MSFFFFMNQIRDSMIIDPVQTLKTKTTICCWQKNIVTQTFLCFSVCLRLSFGKEAPADLRPSTQKLFPFSPCCLKSPWNGIQSLVCGERLRRNGNKRDGYALWKPRVDDTCRWTEWREWSLTRIWSRRYKQNAIFFKCQPLMSWVIMYSNTIIGWFSVI